MTPHHDPAAEILVIGIQRGQRGAFVRRRAIFLAVALMADIFPIQMALCHPISEQQRACGKYSGSNGPNLDVFRQNDVIWTDSTQTACFPMSVHR
jgi:hypothetical protein